MASREKLLNTISEQKKTIEKLQERNRELDEDNTKLVQIVFEVRQAFAAMEQERQLERIHLVRMMEVVPDEVKAEMNTALQKSRAELMGEGN